MTRLTPVARTRGGTGLPARHGPAIRNAWALRLLRCLAPALILLIVAAAVALHAMWLLPNHDNEFLLIAAERMMAGGDYLEAFSDPNPPMIMIVYMPAILLARLLHVDTYSAFSLHVGLLILLAAWVMARPLARCLRQDGGIRDVALVCDVAVLALLPGYEFGQREHLLAVLFLPSLLWFAAREIDGPAPLGASDVLVLVLGAVGALIKPFFLLLPAAIFALRLAGADRRRVLRDPALAIFAAVAVAYGAFTILVFPHYLALAELQGEVYFAWNRAWVTVADAMRDAVLLSALLLLLALLAPVGAAARTALHHCLVASGVCLLLVVMQRKAWTYHLLPVIEFALCGLAILAAILLPRLRAARPAAATAAGLLVAIAAAAATQAVRPYYELAGVSRARYAAQPFLATLRALAQGQSVLMLTSGVQMGFPSMAQVRLGASQPGQLLLPGAVRLAMGSAEERARAAALRPAVVGALVDDLRRFRPDFVAVDRRREKQALPDDFDILAYYIGDAGFRAQWSDYQLVRSIPGWDFYRRAAGS